MRPCPRRFGAPSVAAWTVGAGFVGSVILGWAGCLGGAGVYIPIPLPNSPGVGNDDFVFDPPPSQGGGTATISGDIVDATDSSQAISDAYVYVVPRTGGRSLARQRTRTGGYSGNDGSYTLSSIPAGDYLIIVEPPADSGYSTLSIELELYGGASTSLRVTVVPAALQERIASVVVDPPNALVTPGGSQQYAATVVDTDGAQIAVNPTWTVTNGVGTISSSGRFQAGSRQKRGTIVAHVGAVAGSTHVSVVEPDNSLPEITLEVTPQWGPAPLDVSATAAATDDGQVMAVQIDWGDGEWFESSHFPRTARHQYEAAGTYSLRARALDDGGAEGIAVAYVVVTSDANTPPEVSLTATPLEGPVPLEVTFSGAGEDLEGGIVSWALAFGDDSAQWTGTTAPSGVTHAYEAVGTYEARLVGTDSGGLVGLASQTISVYSDANRPPTASLAIAPEAGPSPLTVTFSGSGADPDGTLVEYRLDFQGDGTNDWTSATPPVGVRYTYGVAGTFSPRLTVVDNLGATATSTRTVVVTQGPELAVSTSLLTFPLASSVASFSIQNVGRSTLEWSLAVSNPWIGVDQTSGTGSASVTVTIDRTLLFGVPTHAGSIAISSNGGTAAIGVRVDTQGPVLTVSPTLLDFGRSENLLTFEISNAGAGELNWTAASSASWLIISTSAAVNDATVTATVDREGLTAGVHVGAIVITSSGGSETVSARVESLAPSALSVMPTSLSFSVGVNAAVLAVQNTGDVDLAWACTAPETWVTLSPSSGTNDGDVTVIVDRSNLADGTHTFAISFTSNGGNVAVPVQVVVPPGDATVIVH